MAKRRCFIIMSFKPEYDVIYQLGIKPAVEDNNLECIRLDEEYIPQNVPTKIIGEIIGSDVIIAEITEASPNVYYELGISHAIGNKTIIISQELTNLPFDIRNENTLGYKNSRDGIKLLYYELKGCISRLLSHPDEPSNIVQIAGRDFFDLRGQIRENLHSLVNERTRLNAFNKYIHQDNRTDNSQIVSILSNDMLSRHRKAESPIMVAISGAAGLGKTTLTGQLFDTIRQINPTISVSVLPMDSFMMDRVERTVRNISGYDVKANDIEKAKESLLSLKKGLQIDVYPYNHQTGEHESEQQVICPANIIIIDGTHSFHPTFLPYLSLRIFLYATPADSKELRFLTDLFDRRYHPQKAFQHAEEEYESFEEHVLHYLKFADLIVTVDNYWEYRIS